MDIINLKNNLKEIAVGIKENKISSKKENSKYSKGDHSTEKIKWRVESNLYRSKIDYRHKFIAYCLLKGTSYERIESTVAEGNEPDWSIIEGVRNAYSS